MRNKIKKRILAMLAVASLFVTPSVTQAQNITKTDAAKAGTITVDGRVTNITPDRTVNGGKTAINQFAHFELDKGNIANLHLEKAGTLVNFVDSKASINGIVNAVKDNKIGGNLYFLSPNGIAVGASGVINAGQVGLITPHKDYYEEMLKMDNLSESHFTQEKINQIPINSDGSIVIEGSINAPGGITLAAQNINIKSGAKLLNTSTIDFSNLVNIDSEVSAGLDSDLVLEVDDNGGIYISARVDDTTIKDNTDITDTMGIGFGKLDTPLTASINIGKDAQIISDNDVTLSSTVVAKNATNFRSFKSELDIAGNIEAQNIKLESTIVDKYTQSSILNGKDDEFEMENVLDIAALMNIPNVIQNVAKVANSYVFRVDEATLNISNTANLKATKNIDVNASSKITTKLTSEALSKDNSGAAAFNATYLENSSKLNIDGTLQAGGNIKLNSTAGADISSITEVNFDKSNNTATSLALNLAMGQNQSQLAISNTADINAGGKLNISSLAKSPVNVKTTLQREGSGLGALTLSAVKVDSQSMLNSEGTLTAKGNINISSKYSAPTYKVNTEISVIKPVSGMEQTQEEAEKTQKAGAAISDYVNGSQSSDSGNSDEESTSGNNITTNATVVMSKHTAYLSLGKVTSTSGNVNIEAANVIDDPQIGGISVVPVEEDSVGVTPVITYSMVDNNSLISLNDDITAKSINVKSNLALDNPRIEQVKNDILEIKPRLEKVYDSVIKKAENAGDEELNAALDEAKTRLDNYLKKIDGTDGTDPMKALTSETNEIVNDLKEYFAKDENVQAIIKTLETATDASKISTVYADRESVINPSGKGGSPNLAIAATALVNMMNNNSAIAIEAGKALRATSGDLNIDSTLKNVGLSVGGHILPKSLDTAATDVIVSVNTVNDLNAIKFSENNSLSGNNISITADNEINHIYLNDGSGKGVNNSYRAAGTVSYAGGSSNAGIDVGQAPIINATDSLKIDVKNNTNIFNVAGGLSYGGGAASVGIGAAVNNFDVNTIANVGNSKNLGSLDTKNVDVKATTDGMVNSLSVAGGLSTSASNKSSDNSNKNVASDTATETTPTTTPTTSDTTEKKSSGIELLDNLADFIDSETFQTIGEIFKHFNDAKSTITETKDKIDKAIDEKVSAVTGSKPDNVNVNKTDELSSQDSQPKVTFDGAGSVSINLGSRNTQSGFAGLETTNLNSVNVGAFDKNFTGAWSGAGALNFRGADSGKTSVAMTGAVAVNKVDSTVEANISANKNLTGAINNTAEKSGALIAAGLGLTVSKASEKTDGNYTGAASASVNLSDNAVKAVLENNTADSAAIRNVATNTDTQITGGVNVSVAVGGKKGVAGGGAGVWSDISNDVNAIIDGGTYKTSGAINNIVSTTLTDVAGGVGVSVAQGSESSYGFQGVFTYNKVVNNAHADIKNADITAGALVNSSSDNKNAAKAYDQTLNGAGLDVSGDSYAEFAKVGDTDSTEKSIESQSTGGEGVAADESVGYENSDYGNKIITAALAVAGAGDGAAQASLAISDVDNDFKSEITNSKVNIGNKTDINATSNTLDINAAAGAAISSKGFGVGGSISWQTNDNEVIAGFDGGNDKKSLTTNALDVKTNNNALEVNVGGQVSGGKGNAAGLAMAYNALNDNTNSYIKNTEIISSAPVDVNINANSSGKVYAVGAGVAVSGNANALNGSIAVNHGSNSTQAILENVKSNSVKNLNVNAQDAVKKLAVVGGITASGGSVAVGGSVAYNDVGTSDNQQLTKVTMTGNEISASQNISVNANDTSDLLTVGVGIGASSKVAVQGSAAVATLNKDVGISLDNSTLNANAVALNAKTAEDLITTADVLSIGGNVAVGAGVSVNNDYTKTGVAITNSNLTAANNFSADSSNSSKVLTIGIGGAAGGTAGVTGSVAVNNLNTNTANNLDKATITAPNGVLINAKGDEAIANYAGTISASGSGAAVGLSVSVNNINSNVQNVVNNSNFNRTASGSFKVNDSIDKNALLNAVVEKETFLPNDTLASHRVNNTYNGVVIDANATHDIKSALFNIGVAGTGAAVNGTVNVNRINGATASEVKNTGFNIDSDINILANDYSNAAGLVGTASAAGTGAGVGVGSDSAVISRVVNASLDMNGKTDNKAKDVNVKSVSQQGVGSLIAGVAFAGVGVGASNGVGVSLVDGTTNASVSNTNGNFDNLNVTSDHLLNLNTLGVSFGAGITGAGVGLSVDILKTQDRTTTAVNNSDITLTQNANVKATNNANVNYQMYDVGAAAIGAGLAGAIGVANVENNVTTDLTNANINSGKMDIAAQNNLDFENKAAVGGLAGLGGGVGVGVSVNTIDSSVNANVNGGSLKASEIALKSVENRNVNQGVGVVAGGLGAATANVMITNVGKELDSSYESATNKDRADKDGSQVNVNENLDKANDASLNKIVGGDNIKSGGMNIELVSDADKKVTAGGAKNSGTHINISGTLNADKISVNNVGTNNLSQGLFTGSAGGISVNGAVGILNLKRNATTNITSNLTAKDLTISNQDGGQSEQNILQGGFGLAAAENVSHGALNVTGTNNIKINGGTLDTTTLNISNSDDSKVNVNSKGVAVSAGRAIGVLIAEGTFKGSNEIEINNATLKGDTISINATAAPVVNVDALALSAGATFAGSGLFAGSINDSAAKISGTGATISGGELNINAENLSAVKTNTGSASGSLFASGSLTGILNNSNAAAAVDFQNATVNAPNTSVNVSSAPSQKVGLVSLGAGGLLAATGSIAGVISNPSATANMSAKKISADDLKITATADSTPEISVKGLTVGAIASGSNLIISARDVKVDATLKADNATLNNLDIDAKTNSAPNLYANGDGGGLVGVAPLAAVIEDTFKQTNSVNLGGAFNVKNSVNVNAQNSDAGTYKADALGAAVIGASGVKLARDINSNAAINFTNANIETEGSQTYTATNNLDYNLDLEAAGYGGLNASAGNLQNKTSYAANINVINSKLTTTGESSFLTLDVQTSGNASSLNNLKATGALEVVTSNSDINTTFDNQINLNGATLTTQGNESAIKLTSSDTTEQKYHTIANIQGGFAGVGIANTANTLTRANSINLNNSTLDAANNVYLNSGESKLTMTAFADVYNKTALPLSTAPELKDNLTLNNTVYINSGSTINAVRNVNINAESSAEVVTESAKEYNVYSGTDGKGNVVVTTGHEGNALETANNFVNIDGTINAGIRNSLKMTISGGTLFDKDAQNINPTVTVTEGADIFDPSSINFSATATMENPFLADYNKAVSDMEAYTPGSNEYNSLYNQVVGMQKIMETYGFAEKMSGTNQYVVYDKIEVPAMELPDISLAGGNIDINTPNLKGNGTLNANAAKELAIDNKTERSLLVNNLTMDTAGGRVYLNGISTTQSGNLKLNTQSNYTPAININNTGSAIKIKTDGNSSAYSKAPDIILNSDKKITNSAGSVTLKNTNGSVLLNGEIYSLTSTKVTTPKGGTIINNTSGLQNVGEDPMLKYTFGNDKVSELLQESIATRNLAWIEGYSLKDGVEKFTFNSYKDYLRFVYLVVINYAPDEGTKKQMLTDVAGTSSWYSGKSSERFSSDMNSWINLVSAKYDTTPTEPAGSIVSGGAVSVIAKTLNVNGLIQSGFNKYIGNTSAVKIGEVYDNASRNLDNDAVIGDKRFRVNDTDDEITYNQQTGMYDKIVGMYYNPKTYQLLTDPIQPTGGVIYLKAQDIVSTGNGKIIAAGGGADIDINGGLYKLVIKDIDTSSRPDPLVMINGVDHSKKSEYTPNSNAVYAWTGGISYNKIEKKSSEAKELFWGLAKIKTTADLVDKLNNEKISIRTISTSDPPKEGDNLQNGVFTDYSGDGNLFTITSARNTGKKVYGETTTSKKEKNIWESIASWILPIPSVITTYTYTWTETTPNYVGTTYRINAAKPIKIQTTNKTDPTINITNSNNIIIESDLGTGANETININSNAAVINSKGSKITAPKINLTAADDIDVTLGLPENKTTELKATTSLNDIKINANTSIENAEISSGKSVNVVSLGDVKGNITAKTLEISTPGNVDVRTQVSDAITIQGDKSVGVTQESGDIKIGKITSKGDVTLNALKGAIVNSVDTAVNMTGAADKISTWQAAGLISDKDSANSATNAAQEEKAVRLEGLENLFKRWALKVDGTVDKKLYNQFINDTVDRTKLTEEQNSQLSLYTSLKYTANFGFSKNQLLYAVQESLLNPSAGTTANISDPIITGKNISLYAKSIGKELEPVTYSNLSSLATLKKLALAKGGDVTYNQNGTITVKEQSPITVKQLSAEDKLNIRTQGNTFISGTDDTKFNVNTPVTAGSGKVVLMTGNGIYSKKGITAKEIELYAGAGDLTANLEAGTSKVMSTVQEPIITTTITYETYTIPLRTLFDRYKNIPGFSVKGEEIGFLNYKCTLTAEYEPNDTTALKALDEAMKAVENPYSVYPSQYTKNAKVTTYSRNDEYGTRAVEKMVEVENDSVGTLTANALGEINIKSYASLPIKNVTSGKDTIIKAEGNIAPIDEKSFIRAEDIDLTAANDIGTKEIPLTIFADAMIFNAKNVYVSDGDPTGGEEGEGSGNNNGGNNGGGNSSGNGNNYTATTMTTTPTNESSPILNNNALLSTKNIVNVTAPANNSSTDKPNITATIINQLDKFSHSLNDTKLLNPESLDFTNKMTLKSSPDNSFQILDDTPVNTEGVDNVTEGAMTFNTAPNQEYYKVALALSRSSALKNKSGYVYSAAAKAWLSGMGYSEEEEQQIIKLSAEIAFNKFSSNSLLNAGIADIVSKYSGSNLNAKKFHDK